MAATYGVVNVLSSFGFCILWRRQCVRHIKQWRADATVVDMMSGMGELWPDILRCIDTASSITAIDISPVMCERAKRLLPRSTTIDILQADILENDLSAVADVVVSSFGLKTFSPAQQVHLAKTLRRILKPGGCFAMLEISVPTSPWLRWPYLGYLRYVIPLVGRLFLGNPECYRMLSVYTEAFGDASHFARACESEGLETQYHRHFFNCASAVSGRAPL